MEITYSCAPRVLARVSRLMAEIRVQEDSPLSLAPLSLASLSLAPAPLGPADEKKAVSGSVSAAVDAGKGKDTADDDAAAVAEEKRRSVRYLPLALGDKSL